jgi:L-alanine-DL-glutamate epimerase-like enolase superfamily enzyme
MTRPLHVRSLRALVWRYPLKTPVVTSFGTMRDRPMVLVRAEDVDGIVGWGEIWCNFPAVGAEHRARLVHGVLAPILTARPFADAADALAALTDATAVVALQSGEPGPFAQAIAGVDIALWDLQAKRAQQPLWRLLGGALPRVRVYASGLNPERPADIAATRRTEGFRAFKLKVGFGRERDVGNVAALRSALGDGVDLMVDANQAWSVDAAIDMARALEPYYIGWLEEPLRADRPWSDWQSLRDSTTIALAAGENLAGDASFDTALDAQVLTVVQPDIAKWGGFTKGVPVARRIVAAGARYCPHWLGGGIGLLASAHALAAVGGGGMLEVDANPNPLRSATCGPLGSVVDGCAVLNNRPGLGIEPDLGGLQAYAVALYCASAAPLRRRCSGASAAARRLAFKPCRTSTADLRLTPLAFTRPTHRRIAADADRFHSCHPAGEYSPDARRVCPRSDAAESPAFHDKAHLTCNAATCDIRRYATTRSSSSVTTICGASTRRAARHAG